ncbi:MAG TPA: hypothetical protein VHX63_05680, partial [Acidobacteriaceae bacterium]|nr:hypothetical protein [Acidobacteriaceae bacterium]
GSGMRPRQAQEPGYGSRFRLGLLPHFFSQPQLSTQYLLKEPESNPYPLKYVFFCTLSSEDLQLSANSSLENTLLRK